MKIPYIKKLTKVMFVSAFIVLFLPLKCICAENFVVDGIEYRPISQSEVAVRSYGNKNSTDPVIIPQYVNGKTVVQIDGPASNGKFPPFKNCKATKITLPDTIRYIGEEAFYGCSNLTQFEIPENCSYIGEKAFYNLKDCKIIMEKINIKELDCVANNG